MPKLRLVKTSEAISYFDGSRAKLAEALGIETPSVYDWRDDYPPPLRQIQLEQVTRGNLKAEPNCFETKKTGPRVKAKQKRKARATASQTDIDRVVCGPTARPGSDKPSNHREGR